MYTLDVITSTKYYTFDNSRKKIIITIGGGSGGGIYDGWKGGVSVDIVDLPLTGEFLAEVGLGSPKDSNIAGGYTRLFNCQAAGGSVNPHGLIRDIPYENNALYTFNGEGAMGRYLSKSTDVYSIFDEDIISFIETSVNIADDDTWIKLKTILSAQRETVDDENHNQIIEYSFDGPYKPGAAGVKREGINTSACSGAIFVLTEQA